MKNVLFDFDNPTKGLNQAAKAFTRAGAAVVTRDAPATVKRTSGVSYKEVTLTFADSQSVVVRVKATGDIFQVVVNGKLTPIKNQDDHEKAIGEIVALLDSSRAKFQAKLAAAKVALPASVRTAAPKLEAVLVKKRDDLKVAIAAVREEIAALGSEPEDEKKNNLSQVDNSANGSTISGKGAEQLSPEKPEKTVKDEIYTDGSYSIVRHGQDQVKLSNGTQSQILRLRKGSDDLTAQQIAQLKKAKLNPGDYFRVDGAMVRRAALPAWNDAVESLLSERKAATDKKAKSDADTIAREGKRALILHGNYLMNASLAFVVPKGEDAATPVGDWSEIDRGVVNAFLDKRGIGEKRRLSSGVESSVIMVTDDEWNGLMAQDRAKKEAMAAKKKAANDEEKSKIEYARAKASSTGIPVEIDRELINSETEDGFVAHIRMIRGDGTIFTKRQILG